MKLKLTGVPPPRKKAAMFFAHPSKSMAKMLRRHPPTMKGRRRPKRDLERLFTKPKEREGGELVVVEGFDSMYELGDDSCKSACVRSKIRQLWAIEKQGV